MTETEIIQKCKAYDKAAFKELVRVYSPALMSVCVRYMGDRHFAEDMLQESYIRIFNNILQYEAKGSFKSWLFRIAATTCLKELRKKQVIIDSEITDYDVSDSNETFTLDDESGILKIIEKLPLPYRLVFNLYVIEGYSHKEIAEMLGITEGTSKSQLARAKGILQKKVAEFLDENRKPIVRQ